MNDKLSKEELEALQANTGAVSLNSIAYHLHIRSPLTRGLLRCSTSGEAPA